MTSADEPAPDVASGSANDVAHKAFAMVFAYLASSIWGTRRIAGGVVRARFGAIRAGVELDLARAAGATRVGVALRRSTSDVPFPV